MFGIKRENKLRVTITDTVTEEKWTLQGRLAWPWVNQLRENWRTVHRTLAPKTCIVDPSGITSVDTIGERMLRSMANDGAQFIVGIDMYRVLECLRNMGSPLVRRRVADRDLGRQVVVDLTTRPYGQPLLRA